MPKMYYRLLKPPLVNSSEDSFVSSIILLIKTLHLILICRAEISFIDPFGFASLLYVIRLFVFSWSEISTLCGYFD